MYCPKCGTRNTESAQRCISCGQVLSGPEPAEGSVQVKTSGLAIAAFVLGILGPFTLGIAAVVAVILGIVALVKIHRSHGRLGGSVFAIIAISVSAVVLVLMPFFIGGTALSCLLRPSGGATRAVAYYGQQEKSKITREELNAATQELGILQALRLDAVLVQQRDMRLFLLGELLFSQNPSHGVAMNQVHQVVQQYQLAIGDRQLSQMYEQTVSPAVYWILLCNEAESAGVSTPADEVSAQLTSMLAQLFPGQTYSAVMASVMNRLRVSEQTVVEAVGRLMSVLAYAQVICSMEDITLSQLKHMASWTGDTLDAEFVKFDARAFGGDQASPSEEAMRAHFDKYKGNVSGRASDDNPFGFGYKLPDRVQSEYVALRMSDVARIVPAPTDEDAMKYYRQNRTTLFTEESPSDPRDPNSPRIARVRPFAEVEELIVTQLKEKRVDTKAQLILAEVRYHADADLPVKNAYEAERLSLERAKARAGDYAKIAQEVAAKRGITLYTGQTGWLSATDVESDGRLGKLRVTGPTLANVPLMQALFSIDAFGPDAGVLIFSAKPWMYITIGTACDPTAMRHADLSDQILMIVRIVGASRAVEPDNLDVTYSTKTLDLGEPSEQKDRVYSVREKAAEDLKILAAWDASKQRVGEFVTMASRQGWGAAVAELNDLYAKQAANDPNGALKLDRLTGRQRVSTAQLRVIAAQSEGSPAAATVLNQAQVEKLLADQLYSLVPAEAASAPNMPGVMEFKPGRCFYAVKNVSVQRLSQQQYRSMKGMLLLREDHVQTQSLAVVHFNPANILKRMGFRPAEQALQSRQEDSSSLGQ